MAQHPAKQTSASGTARPSWRPKPHYFPPFVFLVLLIFWLSTNVIELKRYTSFVHEVWEESSTSSTSATTSTTTPRQAAAAAAAAAAAGHKQFVVWMYPFPPPDLKDFSNEGTANSWWNKQVSPLASRNEILICPYRTTACSSAPNHTTTKTTMTTAAAASSLSFVDLRSLTHGSMFENYIRDHAYHKVRHYKQFSSHLQAIAMIMLLRRARERNELCCVRTLGSELQFCNASEFDNYNPYAGTDLASTNFPTRILHRNNLNNDNDDTNVKPDLELVPDMDTESFATYSAVYGHPLDPHNKYPAGKYNSGEDVQSIAAIHWYPFLSEIRPKTKALVNFTGRFIHNALVSFPLDTRSHYSDQEDSNISEQQLALMKKVDLVSIFMPSITANRKFFQVYTTHVAPFGCRSTVTLDVMLKTRIKSYFSACLTLLTNFQGAELVPNGNNPSMNAMDIAMPSYKQNMDTARGLTQKKKDLVICVDVIDPSAIPSQMRSGAIKLAADLPKKYPNNPEPLLERFTYAYRLLSQYARSARVVITSRIHVGLPALAMGVPVIFVESKNGWLPGGKQRTGRVAGLLDFFHRVKADSDSNKWRFGNGTDIPPNPGNHAVDRHRASFWNRFKKSSSYYEDTGKLFGMVPLQRLGKNMIQEDAHKLFHFELAATDLQQWTVKRAIELVFFFHPNAKVCVHSMRGESEAVARGLEVFVESGYGLEVLPFDSSDQLHKDGNHNLPAAALRHSGLRPCLYVWKHGGVFLSKDTFLVSQLTVEMDSGAVMLSDGSIQILVAAQPQKRPTPELLDLLTTDPASYRSSPRNWNTTILSETNSISCMTNSSWNLTSLFQHVGVAFSLTRSAGSSFGHTTRDTECFRLIERRCIFCDEIYWEFEGTPPEDSKQQS